MQEQIFRKNIELRKEMELLYKSTRYRITYSLDNTGKPCISFGEEFLPPKYFYTYGELVNNAFLGISPLRQSIEALELLNP